MRDSDKNKWGDRAVDLTWTKDTLRKLLAYRVSRAINIQGEILSFDEVWRKISDAGVTRYGNRRKEDTFTHLLRSTLLRPRDVVSHIRECAKAALAEDLAKFDNETIKIAEKAHSKFARREIVDEVHSALSDIDELLDLFAELRKPILSIPEFKVKYERYIRSKGVEREDGLTFDKILEVLFHFSVIGNITAGNHQVFRYNSERARFSFSENICIRRSLLKCLEIY